MDCCQKLMIPSRNDATCMEKTADCLMAFPSFMWQCDHQNNFLGFFSSFLEKIPNEPGPVFGVIVIGISYAVLSVLATPFLMVGSSLKAFALGCDLDAENYNRQEVLNIMSKPLDDKIVKIIKNIDENNNKIIQLKSNLTNITNQYNDLLLTQINGPDNAQTEIMKILKNKISNCENSKIKINKDIEQLSTENIELEQEKKLIEKQKQELITINTPLID